MTEEDEAAIRAELRKRVEHFQALWEEYVDDPAEKPAEGTLLRRFIAASIGVATFAETLVK